MKYRRSVFTTIMGGLLACGGAENTVDDYSELRQGSKGGGKKQTTEFVDGFHDSRTPGVLCPWEQLNACEGRKEVFVVSETKKANGSRYYLDYNEAQEGHVDVCMNERDAPSGLILYGLVPHPIDLGNANGCETPCHLLARPRFVNRLSCHENVALDQSQGVLNTYSLETLKTYTRQSDNYFCHEDYLPPNINSVQCLASTSKYCFRGMEAGETASEYEAYLDACLKKDWVE